VYLTYEMKTTLGVEGMTEARDLAALLEEFFKALQEEDDIPPLSDVVLQDALTVIEALARRIDDSHEYMHPDNAVQTLRICIDQTVKEAESLRLPDDAPMPAGQKSADTTPLKMTAPDSNTRETEQRGTNPKEQAEPQAPSFTPAGNPDPVSPDVTAQVRETFGDQSPPSQTRIQSLAAAPFNHNTNSTREDTPDSTVKTVHIVVVDGVKYGIPSGTIDDIPDAKATIQANRDAPSPTTENAIHLGDALHTDGNTTPDRGDDEMLFIHTESGAHVLRVDAIQSEVTLDCTPLTGIVSCVHGVQAVGRTDDGETVHILDVSEIVG